ncbi:EKC/KEOPS complex subunit LAGE3 [Grammomys surdaster]|uniref:EKC/KEOPS complex subunit LAGE3 n=1 Tax=Grammomys surdaster TaxID=491861 RepID=UPI0010A09983|nr:EKC/KEOPS complex subunit LAGE3 [Grammomys surdaster]
MQTAHTGLSHTADGANGPTGRCCLGNADIMAVIPSGAHPVARAIEASRNSSKSTMPLTQRPGFRHHRFALLVPFPTSLEAEIACGSLNHDVEPHQELVGKELKVSGSMLEVHWIAEDSRLLRISIMNFLDQLSLVVNTIHLFGPPVSC